MTARKHFHGKLWHMYDHDEPVSRWGLTLARRHERRQLKRLDRREFEEPQRLACFRCCGDAVGGLVLGSGPLCGRCCGAVLTAITTALSA